ncbi:MULTISPECIES: hypothetical protein [unclassified Bacillus (in: Bacteria)]|uniref:hypothetical protein n=2 Tax=unclassified Bacillus (in: firmicutes) TaxID=185979 RepID=UPI0011145877
MMDFKEKTMLFSKRLKRQNTIKLHPVHITDPWFYRFDYHWNLTINDSGCHKGPESSPVLLIALFEATSAVVRKRFSCCRHGHYFHPVWPDHLIVPHSVGRCFTSIGVKHFCFFN